MEIPCGTSCFDFTLEYVGYLIDHNSLDLGDGIRNLQKDVRLLHAFDLYMQKCTRIRKEETCSGGDDSAEKDAISFSIKGLINRRMQYLYFVCNKQIDSASPDLTRMRTEVNRFRKAIKLFYYTDINRSFIDFLEEFYFLGVPLLVIDFIHSVAENLPENEAINWGTHREKLRLLKGFICFARFRGVESQLLIDLLIESEMVAMNALRLVSLRYSVRFSETRPQTYLDEVDFGEGVQISPSIDPQVRETYIHVLTAAKLVKPSVILATEEDVDPVADFIHILLQNILQLLGFSTRDPVPFMNLILKLQDGLKFLTTLLGYREKFNEVHTELKNLIGVVVCDAAIAIFSLFVNQTRNGLADETKAALLHSLKGLKFISEELPLKFISEELPLKFISEEVPNPVLRVGFPMTNELGSMDFLLQNLEELAKHAKINGSIALTMDKIQAVQKDLEFLRSFLDKINELRNHSELLQTFWIRVMEVACKAELLIDSVLVDEGGKCCLDAVTREIKRTKIQAQELYDGISNDGETTRATNTFTRMPSHFSSHAVYNEDPVGLDEEVKTISGRLTCGSNRLVVVPIVGMPGLGKTTLANKVYNSPSIMSHFNTRGWCIVSQKYNMHNILVQIFRSIDSGSHREYLNMDEDALTEKLRQRLVGVKYLLVLDDLWDINAWTLLERLLPDNANGSRILITSRLQSLEFKPDSEAYHLRHLNDEESWELLQRKLFGKEKCPPTLSKVGYEIAQFCRGLPLIAVLVAGILANTSPDCWEEVQNSLSISGVLEDDFCMKTLELSYSHLPDDLKACLLYFSVFQEDENVAVRRLTWLWISEGFVRKGAEGKSLENLADDYMKDLIDRSLVMISEQSTVGGVKACRLHDLVHEFCAEKAKEENFLQFIHHGEDPFYLTSQTNPYRVCCQNALNYNIWELMLFCPNLRSLISVQDVGYWLPYLVRVLDLGNLVRPIYFSDTLALLVHLRYLALHMTGSIPSEMAKLSRLQTFVVTGDSENYLLPKTIWNMKTLRQLWATGFNSGFSFSVENLEESSCLDQLETLALATNNLSPRNLQKLLAMLPSIRRLKCSSVANEVSRGILTLDGLSQLESLKLILCRGYRFGFPLNLKKLTLYCTHLPWSEMSAIGKLPNLQVLKSLLFSFVGG